MPLDQGNGLTAFISGVKGGEVGGANHSGSGIGEQVKLPRSLGIAQQIKLYWLQISHSDDGVLRSIRLSLSSFFQ